MPIATRVSSVGGTPAAVAPSAAPVCPGCHAARPDPVGRPGEPVRAFAFAGGGFDTAMQLGVTHALVVSESAAPDVAVGISVGAINAAVLAETLQAADCPEPNLDPAARRVARMSRFREFLYAYQEAPGMLLTGFFPDTYEADAGKALEANQQAIHFSKEREDRELAMQTRTGLVHLLNDVAKLGLSVGAVTRIARAALGMKAAAEEPRPLTRWGLYGQELGRLLRTLLSNLVPVVQVFWKALFAVLRGEGEGGFSAGSIIFRWDGLRRFFGAIFFVLSFPIALLLLVAFALIGAMLLLASRISGVVNALFRFKRAPRPLKSFLTWIRNRILNSYDLLQDLGNAHLVRELLVRLFDPSYYGALDMDRVVEKALSPDGGPREDDAAPLPKPRTFEDYLSGSCPMHVSPIVADLREGELGALRKEYGIVKGLLAAISVTPWLPVVESRAEENYFLDGINIANEPTSALMGLLRKRLHPGVTRAYIYSVAPFPVSADELPGDPGVYSGLVDVVLRSKRLQAFRSAKLERKLARLYSRLLRSTETGGSGALRCLGSGDHAVLSELIAIEPERPLNLNTLVFTAESTRERQEAIAGAVAQGCRATLQAILPERLNAEPGARATISCAAVLSARVGRPLPPLPGAKEVCAACCIGNGGPGGVPLARQALAMGPSSNARPDAAADWPVEMRDQGEPDSRGTAAVEPAAASKPAPDRGVRKPQVALLFSGGVFRGVFQMGVVNALSELGIQPDVIAGSSVGSITAAMIATVFSLPEAERNGRIARLAATYLALDHLVVTDRFADFVRRFTLRAAETQMSPRDLDAFFRRYDERVFERFSGSARRVVAGFDQLFHLSPFALKELVQAVRQRRAALSSRLLKSVVQEFLDRGGVGLEVLGTEPLSLLIEQHVLFDELARKSRPRAVPFQKFRNGAHPIEFLATATNLTRGKLDVIGLPELSGKERAAILVEALLASSAFPGVFRPRWGWEIYPDSGEELASDDSAASLPQLDVPTDHRSEDLGVSQYVDGGVMDNLPLEAVISYLHKRAEADTIVRRPFLAPHLIFTASLESNSPPVGKAELQRMAQSWPEISKRAGQLQYNKKIDSFQTSQREFRRIYEQRASPAKTDWVPLDVEVVVAKPEWLCDTFGFHPMLGFRKVRQAASIAHGCASTLATFFRVSRSGGPGDATAGRRWTASWGASPRVTDDMEPLSVESRFIKPVTKSDGVTCHFRRNASCPFSKPRLLPLGLPESTVASLVTIYRECGLPQNHRRQD